MQITIENTPEIMHANGLPVRVWIGKTGRGTPVLALITRIATPAGDDASELERELAEPPTRLVDAGGEAIAAPRTCTVCNGRGKTGRPAAFVASGPLAMFAGLPPSAGDGGRMQWFECGEHGPTDNLADVTREILEPIAEWFDRHSMPLPGGVGNGEPGAPMAYREPWASMLDVRLTARVAELEAEHAVLAREVERLRASEKRLTQIALDFEAQRAAVTPPAWLVKDFAALYAAAAATLENETLEQTMTVREGLRAQVSRLVPAFDICRWESGLVAGDQVERLTPAERLALDALHRWLHSPGGDGFLIEAAAGYHDQDELAAPGSCERLDREAADDDPEHRSKISVHGALARIRSALAFSDGLEPQMSDPFHVAVRRIRRVLEAHDDRSEPETSPGGTPSFVLPVALTDLIMHHPIAAGDDVEVATHFIRWAMRGAIEGHHARRTKPDEVHAIGREHAAKLDEPDREAWLTGFRIAVEARGADHCWKCGMTLGRFMTSDGERRICVRCNGGES